MSCRGAMLVLCLVAAIRADQVILKNGDRLSGSIVKKDSKSLTIKGDSIGSLKVPWTDVVSLSTAQPIYLELSTGEQLRGSITLQEDRMILFEGGTDRALALADIAALRDDDEQRRYERLLNPGLTEAWAGTALLGLAGTQGNAETRTFTASLAADRVTNTDKTTIYLKAIRASALLAGVDASTAQAVRGGWTYSRNIFDKISVNTFNDYEYDRFQNLDLRFVLGGGLGYMAWKGERGRFDILAGSAYNREKFSPRAPAAGFTRNSAEAYFGDDFTYQLNSVTSVHQNMRFFPNLSDTGSYRINFDVSADTNFYKWLTWTIALSDRFLSNPVPGRQKNDFLYTTGIGISFTR